MSTGLRPRPTAPATSTPPIAMYPDPQRDQMLELMDAGMDQWSASLIAYSGDTPVRHTRRVDWSIWVSHLVLRLANELRAELGLPLLAEVQR